MPLQPFAVDLSEAPAYWSLGELLTRDVPHLLTVESEEVRRLTLAAHYGAEVLEDWP